MNEKRKKTVCFTGHRQMGEAIQEVERRLITTIEGLILKGYIYYGAGGARGFDALASEVVLRLKATHPQIHLILVLPFDEQYKQEGNWTQAEVDQYHNLKERASKVVVLSQEYSSGVYFRRNRHLVDNSSLCISYMNRSNTGTSYTVNFAKSRGLEVINIAL